MQSGSAGTEHRAANEHASAAYRWVDIMLEVTGREVDRVGARPTIISRQRPWTLVRHSPRTFVTPPFPGYPSRHSTAPVGK